ncbi:MAG: hypothetical protein JNL52_01275 [Flavobacteriales bacterium]|nr:hypothetical protein [Flavobacteriales bacterium]
MDLQRRLTLYLFGLIIGGGMAYFIYGERLTSGAWLPEHKVKQRLESTLLKTAPQAETALSTWPADLEAVRKSIPSATVSFKESVRTDDSIYYTLDGVVDGKPARFVIVGLRDFDRDSTATLWSLKAR